MKKRVIFFASIFLFFISVSNALSYQINSSVVSFQRDYGIGDSLNLTFFLNFTNLTPDWSLETSEGHKISLRDLLKLNGKPLSCESYNCERKYSLTSEKMFSTSTNPSEKRNFGFFITDSSLISLSDIFFNLSTSFQEEKSSQLGLNISHFNGWNYASRTNNYSSFFSSGCFDLSKNFSYRAKITDTRYCEKISSIPRTNKALLGANFSNPSSQDKVLTMGIYRRYSNEPIGTCFFNSSAANSCLLTLNDEIEGEFYVCIYANSQTEIYLGFQENQNPCGIFGSSSSNGDYYLFIKTPTYSSLTGELVLKKENFSSETIARINNYLSKNYRNCSVGCIIPFYFFGVNQPLTIRKAKIDYNSRSGILSEEGFYSLSLILSNESFAGYVNLSGADFRLNYLGERNISFYLTNENERITLFSEKIKVRSKPLIFDVYPKKVPALINVTLNLEYFSKENVSRFVWYFVEDNVRKITYGPKISYIFHNSSNYSLVVSVEYNNTTITNNFSIEVVPPTKNMSRTILETKEKNLEELTKKIDNLSSPFVSNKLKLLLSLESVESYLDDLNTKLDEALTDDEILLVTEEIFSLAFPSSISLRKEEEFFFLSPEQISFDVISLALGKDTSDSKYKEYVSYWTVSHLSDDSKKINTRINFLDENNRTLANFLVMEIRINPDEEALLFVPSQNFLEASMIGENAKGFKKFSLSKNNQNSIEILINGSSEPQVFVLPKNLSKLLLSPPNLGPCNFNKVCEKDLGENYKNCRSDCKPWGIAILLIILIFIVTFILYFVIVTKLKEAYERKLFKSSRDLLNLISFFKSYEERGLSRKEAIERLINAGWKKEQVIYAVKKAKGERTRPYEIIPTEKIKQLFSKK